MNRPVSRVLLGALLVTGAAGLWAAVQYRNQGKAFDLPSQANENAEVATGKVNKESGYILVRVRQASHLETVSREEELTEESPNASELAKLGVKRFKVPTTSTTEEAARRVAAKLRKVDPTAAASEVYAEPDAQVEPDYVPNDTNYASQWHLPKIGGPVAWDTTTGSPSIIIGIADTGVDCAHLDLVDHCVAGWNFYDNNSTTADVYGHGTAVAGSAAAVGDNARQVAGIAYNAKIMPLRISDTSGYGYSSTVSSAITYAADHGVRAVNVSYRFTGDSTVDRAANYLRSKGGLVTSSSGNQSTNITVADTPNIITVGASDSADNRASWSNWGPANDVIAPGVGIYTTSRGGGLGSWSGTSFSSPITAGVLALIFSTNPSQFPTSVAGANLAESFLKNSVKDLGTTGRDDYFGWGRVDAAAAIALALTGAVADTTAPSVPAGLTARATGSTAVSLSWTASTDMNGVAGYDIYRDGTKIATTVATSYTDSDLVPETTYSYTVTAYDAAQNYSAASTAATVTTPLDTLRFTQAPYVVSKTATSVTLGWTTSLASTGTVTYMPTRKGTEKTASENSAGTTHTLIITGLSANTSYSFTVRAADSTGAVVTSTASTFKTARK